VAEEPLAQEFDNCPKCNKTLILQLGFIEGAYEGDVDEEPNVWYATCDICGTKFRVRDMTNDNGYPARVYDKWVCLIPRLNLRFLNIRPFVCRWWKVKEKPIPVDLSMT
jgi:transcription elongation factor Elf1